MRLNNVFHKGVIKQVDCIAVGHISFIEDIPKTNGAKKYGEWVDLDEVEFIPITEERLLGLGLVKDDMGMLFELPKYIQDKCNPDNGFKKSAFFFNNREDLKMWMDCQTRVCIKYVHEVQNLIFALTNEELELKPCN
jgi:hypothetical protein